MAKKFPTVLPEFKLKKRHVKLLKHAQKRVRDGLNGALCGAISMGAVKPEESGIKCSPKKAARAATKLKIYIMCAIEGAAYFDSWQYRHGIIRSDEEVRSDRVKWVDYILENAERK